MAHTKKTQGMHGSSDRKTRGRTSIAQPTGPSPTRPHVPQDATREANRPVSAGTRHRGDRRDMSKTYTGNQPHSSRGNNPRPDVKTRKR